MEASELSELSECLEIAIFDFLACLETAISEFLDFSETAILEFLESSALKEIHKRKPLKEQMVLASKRPFFLLSPPFG